MYEAEFVEMANNLVTREIPTRFQSKDCSSNDLTEGRSAQEVLKKNILVMPYEALVNLITEESPRYLGVVDLELIIQAWNGTDENNYMGLNCKLFLIGRDQDD